MPRRTSGDDAERTGGIAMSTTGYNTEAEHWASVLGGQVTDHNEQEQR